MRTDGWTTEHTQRCIYLLLAILRTHLKTAKREQMKDKQIKRDFNIDFGICLHAVISKVKVEPASYQCYIVYI